MAKPERDATPEFLELMNALDGMCDDMRGEDIESLDVAHQRRIVRVVLAHLEFRRLCESFDVSLCRRLLSPGALRLDS